MKAPIWILALALLVAMPVMAQDSQDTSTQATSADAAVAADEDIDEEWLNTVWTQVDDVVKTEEAKLQETVTVAGVRGAEAEDAILDKLYYKGAKRYPSQDKLLKAIETLKKAVADSPKGDKAPMQSYFIAQCYEKLGRTADARAQYQRVAEQYADTTWATKAKKDLTRL